MSLQKWAEVLRPKLQEFDSLVQSHKFVCSEHFIDQQYEQHPGGKKILLKGTFRLLDPVIQYESLEIPLKVHIPSQSLSILLIIVCTKRNVQLKI